MVSLDFLLVDLGRTVRWLGPRKPQGVENAEWERNIGLAVDVACIIPKISPISSEIVRLSGLISRD
jgi:hypothetical protein